LIYYVMQLLSRILNDDLSVLVHGYLCMVY